MWFCAKDDGTDYCGSSSEENANCYCDNVCSNAGDCCSDYQDVCLVLQKSI